MAILRAHGACAVSAHTLHTFAIRDATVVVPVECAPLECRSEGGSTGGSQDGSKPMDVGGFDGGMDQ